MKNQTLLSDWIWRGYFWSELPTRNHDHLWRFSVAEGCDQDRRTSISGNEQGPKKIRLYSAIGFGGDISCQNFPPGIMIICGGFQSLKDATKAAGPPSPVTNRSQKKERKTRRFDHAKHQIPEQFHAASEKDPNLLYKSDS